MSCDWTEVVLKDVITFNPKESLKKGQLAKKVAMEELKPFTRKISGFVTEQFSGGAKFRNGDTLLARITPCLENGKTAYVDILDQDEVAFGSTEFIVMRAKPEKTDSKFVYYLATSPAFRSLAIQSMTGSSGRQRIQNDLVENAVSYIPPLDEQNSIGKVLSSLDDKIELNNRINKTLEEMAQAIFKEWFVDFDFPDENGQPYKSSGGEMEESELGLIPKGWKVGTISDLGEIVGGGTPSKKEESYYTSIGIPWITPKDLSDNRNKYISRGSLDISELGYKNSSAKKMPKGTVLFSSRAPIGYVAIAKNEITTNQGFKSIIPYSHVGSEFVYYFLKWSTDLIESRASGSTFKEISGGEMKKIPAIIPETKILAHFNDIIGKMGRQMEKSEEENQITINIRDSLLPKLMSGEIRVPVEEVPSVV